jgi:hypothetical protein
MVSVDVATGVWDISGREEVTVIVDVEAAEGDLVLRRSG